MIRETIVTTTGRDGAAHIAPIGIIQDEDHWVIAPFRPSATLENLHVVPYAVANYTDDVLVFAGCLTGRRTWATRDAAKIPGAVLQQSLAHAELAVVDMTEDAQRPRFRCRVVHEESHAPFQGFNRAQAAVVEAAILVSRLHMLPWDKIEREIAYLEIAVTKTAGPREQQAWDWLMDRIAAHRAAQDQAQEA